MEVMLILEWCKLDLSDLFRSELSPAEIKTLIKHFFEGLNYLHTVEAVIHRDLKVSHNYSFIFLFLFYNLLQ